MNSLRTFLASRAEQFLYEHALAVDLGLGPGAAFPFGEFDPQAGSNPPLLAAIYGQRAFVSCHRCPQMAKLNMPPKSCERNAGGRLQRACSLLNEVARINEALCRGEKSDPWA